MTPRSVPALLRRRRGPAAGFAAGKLLGLRSENMIVCGDARNMTVVCLKHAETLSRSRGAVPRVGVHHARRDQGDRTGAPANLYVKRAFIHVHTCTSAKCGVCFVVSYQLRAQSRETMVIQGRKITKPLGRPL